MGYRTTAVSPTLLLLLICCALPSFAGNNKGKYQLRETPGVEPDNQQALSSPTTINDNPLPSTIIDTAKSLFSPLSTTRFALLRAAASNSWTWIKLKTLLLFKKSQDFPSAAPSLDFRRQASGPEKASADADADADTEPAKEKVKEAILKSLDQGTVVIENSARSAAKLAGDAMDTTAKKLQKTLGTQSEAEL